MRPLVIGTRCGVNVSFGAAPGSGMRVTVPALVEHGIPQAKVGADVDDRAALVEPRTGLLRGLTRRKRGEDDLSVADVGADHERIGRRVQVRLELAQWLALA